MELNIQDCENYLQDRARSDRDAARHLQNFRHDDIKRTVSNVVSDNVELKKQLQDAKDDIKRLEIDSKYDKNQLNELKSKIEDIKNLYGDVMK